LNPHLIVITIKLLATLYIYRERERAMGCRVIEPGQLGTM